MKLPVTLDAASLRQAIVVKELLDRPLALRRVGRRTAAPYVNENRTNEIKQTKE